MIIIVLQKKYSNLSCTLRWDVRSCPENNGELACVLVGGVHDFHLKSVWNRMPITNDKDYRCCFMKGHAQKSRWEKLLPKCFWVNYLCRDRAKYAFGFAAKGKKFAETVQNMQRPFKICMQRKNFDIVKLGHCQ
jgi:MoaA/NifB/PqqE/SkfB family radical SAM enzyme